MKQFRKIFNFELKYYLKNKVFAGVTIFLVLLIAAVMFFPRIMEAFKSEDDSGTPATGLPVMLIKADEPETQQKKSEAESRKNETVFILCAPLF